MKSNKIFKNIVILGVFAVVNFSVLSLASTSGTYVNGAYKSGATYYGVKGNIECDPVSVSDGSYAYLMLSAGNPSTSNSYIKAGWCREATQNNNYHFYEVCNDLAGSEIYYSNTASTGTHSYEISNPRSDGYYDIIINGLTKASFYGYDLDMLNPKYVAFLGEVAGSSDQNPGTTNDPITMGYLKAKNASGLWINATFTTAGIKKLTFQKNNSAIGAYSFEQWDSRY